MIDYQEGKETKHCMQALSICGNGARSDRMKTHVMDACVGMTKDDHMNVIESETADDFDTDTASASKPGSSLTQGNFTACFGKAKLLDSMRCELELSAFRSFIHGIIPMPNFTNLCFNKLGEMLNHVWEVPSPSPFVQNYLPSLHARAMLNHNERLKDQKATTLLMNR